MSYTFDVCGRADNKNFSPGRFPATRLLFFWLIELKFTARKYYLITVSYYRVCYERDHSSIAYARCSEKLTFLTPWSAHLRMYVCQGLRISFSEDFLHVLNKWSQNLVKRKGLNLKANKRTNKRKKTSSSLKNGKRKLTG